VFSPTVFHYPVRLGAEKAMLYTKTHANLHVLTTTKNQSTVLSAPNYFVAE